MTAQPMTAPARPLRVHPVPDRAPAPWRGAAGERVGVASEGEDSGRRQGALTVTRRGGRQGRLSLVPTAPVGTGSTRGPLRPLASRTDEFAPRPTSTADLPEPRGWAGQMALCALQVVAGVRAPGQLARFTSPGVYEAVTRRRLGTTRAGAHPVRPTRVRAVVLSEPADGVVDASIVIDDGRRARAVGLRMVGLDGRWLVTELVIG